MRAREPSTGCVDGRIVIPAAVTQKVGERVGRAAERPTLNVRAIAIDWRRLHQVYAGKRSLTRVVVGPIIPALTGPQRGKCGGEGVVITIERSLLCGGARGARPSRTDRARGALITIAEMYRELFAIYSATRSTVERL